MMQPGPLVGAVPAGAISTSPASGRPAGTHAARRPTGR
jgi:hypothetical protein